MSERSGAEPAFSGGKASVRIYMADSVASIDPGATMQDVVDELDADEVGLLLVGTAAHVVGVVSERDVVRMLAARRDPAMTRAIDVASTNPVWCEATATVHEVAELMMEQYVRHVLVGENGKLVGIVSARDLLGAYTASTRIAAAPEVVTSEGAEQLAAELLRRARDHDSGKERRRRRRVSRLLDDAVGKAFILELTDEILRIRDPARAAARRLDDLISTRGLPRFAGPLDRLALRLAGPAARRFPRVVMPAVVARLRREFAGVVLPAEERAFATHAARRRAQGIRLNVNVLGEAILGDDEAARRLVAVIEQLRRPEVDYVSVKISAVCAQIDVLAFAESLERVAVPVRALYDEALRYDPPKFVNLDMEEFRDLELTTAVFRAVLDEAPYRSLDAGVVLQAYLPDSFTAAEELANWATQRRLNGGGRTKIRVVKGANLAMEAVEAELHGWPLARYGSKRDVDANYKSMLDVLIDARYADAVRLGVASHNLFDVAWALEQRDACGATHRVEIEMLEGMANPQALAVRDVSGDLLLYAPVARRDDFESAIAYLVRRLDENTGPDNFLRALFSLEPGSPAWDDQRDRFRQAVADRHHVSHRPHRRQDRDVEDRGFIGRPFANEPDTDFALAANRRWITRLLAGWADHPIREVGAVVAGVEVSAPLAETGTDPSHPGEPAYRYVLADVDMVERAATAAAAAQERWVAARAEHRRDVLLRIAEVMAAQRGRTLAAMAYDAGKTIREGDPEVSEAIDFACYYAARAGDLDALTSDGLTFAPYGTVLVASPWNFPYAIPAGGVCAALAAGNAVIFKPAPESVLTARVLAEQCWEAGVPGDLLQFLPCRDDEVGRRLVTHDGIGAVVLTGAYDTARLFLGWKPALRLHAETSGKNAIVITAAADIDLAVRDLVRSAFGHAGQKCSAASLAIVEASVYDDPTFLPRVADATRSMKVGASSDLATVVGPLIRPPAGPLADALVRLDDGESWLVAPKRLDESGYSWSPGVKIGVRAGSAFHLTECFGPVLGVMRARDLDDAIALQNQTPYGLTAGLFSLDEREIARWCGAVQAGNLYVNRHITGAIVQRQPFGGWKRSAIGPGAKAGGPNYVASLGTWRADRSHDAHRFASVAKQVWDEQFRHDTDATGLRAERNSFGYRPYARGVLVRVAPGAEPAVIESCRVAARLATTPITVTSAVVSGAVDIVEDDDAFRARLPTIAADKVRVLGYPDGTFVLDVLASGAAHDDVAFVADPRVELHRWVREQAISETRHRHGNLIDR